MRALTEDERKKLRERMQRWQLSFTATAEKLEVSAECLKAALDGKRIQVAKRIRITKED
jgi:hypothetical protein